MQYPLHAVFITSTETEPCNSQEECARVVQNLQTTHQYYKLQDLPYSFLIGGDGRVYEGRGWAHSISPPFEVHPESQWKSIIIAKIGPRSVADPCKFMERAVGSLIDNAIRERRIDYDTNYYFQENDEAMKNFPFHRFKQINLNNVKKVDVKKLL
ncbi:peptidoglycan-recognition protein LF-like [Macrosteles quadrilineatus]|uniref:peptidoglycan-recognition protein LF-like n=1 Tax=Macrosteles quadrilineatus TaxID=74068 RepID=UPI0023E0DD05|nr:peptidoglycan-recognition protein LF-like [Macrosteles quadrilineatus]